MLNPLARTAIAELNERGVHDLTSDEVVTLHLLGEKLLQAGKSVDVVIDSIPVSVGNVILYPLTACAADWFDMCYVWFDDRPSCLFWALSFALANARNYEVFKNLDSSVKAQKAIYGWMKTLTATKTEIDLACQAVLEIETSNARASAKIALSEVVEFVASICPEDAETLESVANKYLVEQSEDEEDVARRPEYEHWKVTCASLATLTGTSLEEWYRQDRRLVVHMFAIALEKLKIQAGGGDGKKTGGAGQQKVVEATKNLYAEVGRIIKARENRKADNG